MDLNGKRIKIDIMATTLNIDDLLSTMTKAAKKSLSDSWPDIRDLAVSSLRSLAQTLIDIETMQAKGSIDNSQAQLLITMQKNTLKIVLLSEEGLGLLAAENAINAVIDSIETVVSTALGFAL
jgi:hypothetical protein